MSPQHKNNSTNFKTSLQSITSAVTAMKGIKAGAIGSNGLFDSATVNAYRASIKGLSATQAEAALSASGLNAAQRQQILTSKESTVANAGQATSFNVLTKAVWANVKAMAKWLVTTPTGWITLAIGATVGLITAYNNVEKKQNELIENARNLQEEYRSFAKDTAGKISSLEGQAEEFNKLAKGVDKYGNNISLASDEYDRYKSIVAEILGYSPELIQGYDAEGNAIADKNGLLERSIELLKEEQRLKLKEMTTDEKTGEAYDAAEAGWQQVQGYEGANTRNEIARWFNNNALRGGVNYEVDIAEVLGIKDEWKEEGNNLQNAIINNIDTVVKNIKDKKAELLAISDSDGNAIFSVDEIDNMIDLSNDWQYAYNQWQQDIEDAKHGMDDQFDLYAQRAKSYNDLTDAQKVFVSEYIRATGDIVDAEGNLLSKDAIIEKAKNYTKFVERLASDSNFEVARTKINTLFSLDKSQMPIGDYIKQVNGILVELQKEFDLTDEEISDFRISLGLTSQLIQEYIGTLDNKDSINAFINTIEEEAKALGITSEELGKLTGEHIIFNNTSLKMEDKIAAIKMLESALGDCSDEMKYLLSLFNAAAGAYSTKNPHVLTDGDRTGSAELELARIFGTFNKVDIPEEKDTYTGTEKDKGSSSDKNKPDYEDPTDAIINRINLRSKELEQQEESIQNAIEIAELENDYKKQISLTNDLIAKRKDRLTELERANAGLHNEAEYLRNSNPWSEEKWFDSQGNATEAYYELLNNTATKEEQEQIKDLFEKLSKYKEAYKDNAEEILDINKQLIEDEETLSELYSSIHEGKIRDIEHERDLALEANPFVDTTSYYKQLQDVYHEEAERLRALDPEKYKEEIQELQQKWIDAQNSIIDWRWENSQNWISDRNTYNDWGLFDDSEIDAWERVIKWLNEEYPNDLDKIKEAEQSLFDARVKNFEKGNDLANKYFDSQKGLLQKHFDIENSIASVRHEINKELAASMTMYEYLDEESRKLLFNQEDFNTLSEELYEIEYKANKLQRQYTYDLENATLETIEEITANYEMQYETLMKSYEIAKADLEVAKKKQKLNNVLNERNVRMFINGQWQWVADTQEVINAQSELADAEYAQKTAEAGLRQTNSMNELTRKQNELGTVISQFKGGIITLDEAVILATSAIGSLPDAIESLYLKSSETKNSTNSSSSKPYSSSTSSNTSNFKSNATAWIPGVGDVKVNINSSGKTTTSGLPVGTIVHTADGDFKIIGGSGGNYTSEPVNKHAEGTRYTPGGLTLMGESGDEYYIPANGYLVPINQPTIGNIPSGGIVFNTEQMKNLRTLWDMSRLTPKTDANYINGQPQQINQNHDNRIIINGMTVDSGSSDGQALISALRRYIGNH